MGLLKNILSFMGFETEEGYEGYSNPEAGLNVLKEQAKKSEAQQQLRTQKAALIDLQTIPKKGIKPLRTSGVSTEMILCEPKTHDDSQILSNYIKQGKPVIVNLKYLDATAGKRLIDFVCGTVYAFDGHMQKLGGNIFLFTPQNIDIVNKQHDEFEFNQEKTPAETAKVLQEEMFYKTA